MRSAKFQIMTNEQAPMTNEDMPEARPLVIGDWALAI
jgi:hypothetical protein